MSFLIIPRLLTSTVTVSPGFIHNCGSRLEPTPPGGLGGSGGSGGSEIKIKTSLSGDLTKVDGGQVEVNLVHPAYHELKRWFKKQN